MYTDIKKNDQLIGQIYNFNNIETIGFPTPLDECFQLGFGYITEDKQFVPHIHKKVRREVEKTSEFLYVISGEIIIDIYDEHEEFVSNIVLQDGMGLLQFTGGHKILMKKNTKYFELKQGPYLGRNVDKYELSL